MDLHIAAALDFVAEISVLKKKSTVTVDLSGIIQTINLNVNRDFKLSTFDSRVCSAVGA